MDSARALRSIATTFPELFRSRWTFFHGGVWVYLVLEVLLALRAPLAVHGLGFVYVGSVLRLPPWFHYSKVHTRINLVGLGVWALAFVAIAVHAFWPFGR